MAEGTNPNRTVTLTEEAPMYRGLLLISASRAKRSHTAALCALW